MTSPGESGNDVRGQGIDPNDFIRDTYTQFQNWLGETKSSEGCPVNCTYCFFKLDGQTPKRPDINMSAAETIDAIGNSPTYHPDMPIHFGSQTDVFSTPRNIAHYREILQRYGESEYPNPVVFITKRCIPQNFMAIAKDVSQPVLFYLSYSGLGGTGLEPTVRDEHLRENFSRLKEYDLPRVHYWRPFMPQNSKPGQIADMLEFVSKYADCSTAHGLKLNSGIRDNIAPFWPQIMDSDYDFQHSGSFWPEGVRPFLQSYVSEKHPDYPLFFDTACSLAYVLNKPDTKGVLGGEACLDSNCPPDKRVQCELARTMPSEEAVIQVGTEVGVTPSNIALQNGIVVINEKVATGGLVYMRSKLRLHVISNQVDYGGHNWASSADTENRVIEVPWTRT